MSILEKLPDNIKLYIEQEKENLLDGYIRFLKEDEISDILTIIEKSTMWQGGIPFATTVFGDLIVWEDGYVILYLMSEEDYTVILSGTDFFFELIKDKEYQLDHFQLDLYKEAKSKLGEVAKNECYVLEPIPRLGGKRSLEYMNIGELTTYLYLLS